MFNWYGTSQAPHLISVSHSSPKVKDLLLILKRWEENFFSQNKRNQIFAHILTYPEAGITFL